MTKYIFENTYYIPISIIDSYYYNIILCAYNK